MRFFLKLAVVLVLALLSSVFVWYRSTRTDSLAHLIIPAAAAQTGPAGKRPVYPHSVVPGGVGSGKEVREKMASDPVVSKHYQGVDPERLRAGKLTKDVEGYVSYRVKDKVYWTKRKVRLRKGELILCAGEDCIRARCGNRIAFIPQRPFLPAADEPQEPDFDNPLPDIPVQMADLRLVPDFTGPVPPFLDDSSTVARNPPANGGKKEKQLLAMRHPRPLPRRPIPPAADNGSPGQPGEIGDVPEPATILLVAAGLAAVALRKKL